MTVHKNTENWNVQDRQNDAGEHDDDPEHEDKELSFLEHLVELRSRLLKACVAILVVPRPPGHF